MKKNDVVRESKQNHTNRSIKCPYFFDLLLEAKAEQFEKILCFFCRFENTKRTF